MYIYEYKNIDFYVRKQEAIFIFKMMFLKYRLHFTLYSGNTNIFRKIYYKETC